MTIICTQWLVEANLICSRLNLRATKSTMLEEGAQLNILLHHAGCLRVALEKLSQAGS